MTIKSLVLASACLVFRDGVCCRQPQRGHRDQRDSLAPRGHSKWPSQVAEPPTAPRPQGRLSPAADRAAQVFSLPASISFATNSSRTPAPPRISMLGWLRPGPQTQRGLRQQGGVRGAHRHHRVAGAQHAPLPAACRIGWQYFIREFGISPSFVGAIGVGPQQPEGHAEPGQRRQPAGRDHHQAVQLIPAAIAAVIAASNPGRPLRPSAGFLFAAAVAATGNCNAFTNRKHSCHLMVSPLSCPRAEKPEIPDSPRPSSGCRDMPTCPPPPP